MECSLGRALTTVGPAPLNCKNEYLVLAVGEKIAAHAVVGSIDVSQARKAKESGDERPRLRAS